MKLSRYKRRAYLFVNVEGALYHAQGNGDDVQDKDGLRPLCRGREEEQGDADGDENRGADS